MVEEKGLPEAVADQIGEYVKLHGGKELLEQLAGDSKLMAVQDAQLGIGDMRLLLQYCEMFGVLDKVSGLTWEYPCSKATFRDLQILARGWISLVPMMLAVEVTICLLLSYPRCPLTSALLEVLTTTLVSSMRLS